MLAPNGDLITANGDAVNPDPNQTSELVEFTPEGQFVGQFSLDPNAGGAFGLAATNAGGLLRLAAVDDNTNSLDVWTFRTGHASPDTADAVGITVVAAPGADSTSTVPATSPPTGTLTDPLPTQGPAFLSAARTTVAGEPSAAQENQGRCTSLRRPLGP